MSGKRWILAALVAVAVLVCGCTLKHELLKTPGRVVVKPQFSDIPVPENFELLKVKSYHFEYDWKDVRHARLFYRGDYAENPPEEVKDYYRKNMLMANWRLTSSAGGDKTMMVFEKVSGTNKERCVVVIYAIQHKTLVEIQLDPIQ